MLLNIKTFVAFIILFVACNASAGSEDISVQRAHEMAKNQEVVLIDVRSKDEWKQTGIAANAYPISMHRKGGMETFTQDLLKLLNGDKTAPVALICAGGVRSAKVSRYLEKQGFTQLYNVKAGMVGNWVTEGWIDQGMPVIDYRAADHF